ARPRSPRPSANAASWPARTMPAPALVLALRAGEDGARLLARIDHHVVLDAEMAILACRRFALVLRLRERHLVAHPVGARDRCLLVLVCASRLAARARLALDHVVQRARQRLLAFASLAEHGAAELGAERLESCHGLPSAHTRVCV